VLELCWGIFIINRFNANPNAIDNQGITLLMMAAEKGDYELVKVLIDHNCDINIKNN